MFLKPIKTFYSSNNPTYAVFEEAKQIAINEDCVVEVRWCPDIMVGWYHDYVFADSNISVLADKVPQVYGW